MADNVTKLNRDPGRQAEQTVQPDPMLQTKQQASPTAVGIASVFALIILSVVFYGLNYGGSSETTNAASTTASAASTSGKASSNDTSGPSPADQANTANRGTGNNQGGAAQPANQGQGDAAGPNAARPGAK